MTTANIWALVVAALLVVLAALFAAADAALSRVSRSRVEELATDRRRGAKPLAGLIADPALGVNAVLLLRTLCETSAVVLVALTFVETHDGRVRYFCYASDVERAVEHVDAAAGSLEKLLAKIQAWSGVLSTRTNLVLSTSKETTRVKVEAQK